MKDKAELVKTFVGQKLAVLSVDSPVSKANLAKLRRGVGKDIRESPESWYITLEQLPQELCGTERGGCFEPSRSENAIHATLTLFAMHMQGRSASVDVPGVSFAKACNTIANDPGMNTESIKRRFDSILSSSDIQELSRHVRSMVQVMKSCERVKGFDYRGLAKDLYYYQYPDGMHNVMLSWGQDFYSKTKLNDLKTE